MKTGIYIGRFQPFHKGHRACVEHILTEADVCQIFIRDTELSDKNPFTFEERSAQIRNEFPNEAQVKISKIDDPSANLKVYIGRDVGYDLIQLDEETEKISATDIRKKLYANQDRIK